MRAGLLSVALLALAVSTSATVHLFDSAAGRYLKTGENVAADRSLLSSVDAALLGLLPADTINQRTSQQIEGILTPSVFNKPRALVSLSVAGLTAEDLASVFGSRGSRTLDVEHTAQTVAAALSELQQANTQGSVVLLDDDLQNCESNCVAEHLAGALTHASGSIKDSRIVFNSGASLDLGMTPAKLYAVEASTFAAGVKAQLQALVAQEQKQTAVVGATLLSLDGLAKQYGARSEELASCKSAMVALLKWAVAQLDEALGGDVVYQVAVFKTVTTDGGAVEDAMAWKENTRRVLQAGAASAPWPGADDAKLAKDFTAKACGYGAFILLVYFILAGVYCMCNMPMAADTLLFGSAKKDS